MEIREILQTEIWSKQTSRKILVGLMYLGIGLGVVFLGFVLWFWIWTHWLTAKERSAGKTALAQVEALQNLAAASDIEFDEQDRLAQEKVDAANKAVLTAKDNEIAITLSICLDELRMMRRDKKMQERLDSLSANTRSEHSKVVDSRTEAVERDAIKNLEGVLHELLDK